MEKAASIRASFGKTTVVFFIIFRTLLGARHCAAFSTSFVGRSCAPTCFLSTVSHEEAPLEEDSSRWENMYNQGAKNMFDDAIDQPTSSASQIRVVTFDLDNTLWKTGPTIAGANDELANFLDKKKIVQPERVEHVMGELFKRSKSTYATNDDAKAPTKLTQLRKDALKFTLLEHNDYDEKAAEELAHEAFNVWTTARHDLIPSHFASDVVETLKQIRSLQSSSGQPVLIGAVTDGNSDPRNVPILKSYFDFVVNAEMVGVSKPDRKVYLAAIQEASKQPLLQDIFGRYLESGSLTEENIEDLLGPWWVHVGDDFVKDMVAAKSMGMRCVWTRELVKQGKPQQPVLDTPKNKKTLEEFVKQVSDNKGKGVIEMSVGGEDYLAESMREEFADAINDNFGDLAGQLLNWHQEALSKSEPEHARAPEPVAVADADTPILQVISPDPKATPPAQSTSSAPDKAESAEATAKFCMFCGTKLPIKAIFCSSCGEKQPAV